MKTILVPISLLFFGFVTLSLSQSLTERYNHLGKLYLAKLTSAPFPHPIRIDGHHYKGKIYPAKEHYTDSSVAIFIPKDFRETGKTNLVVYFHGWNNNIDKACAQFELIEQFSQSNKNAIFVFPEGPKNTPDSHGGKLQGKDGLKNLINDVLAFLSDSVKISITNIGNIILAGHSGANQVISFCLEHGGLTQNISDVLLFDALYGRTEKFLNWITTYNGRLINIYTDNGGTKKESKNLMTTLDSLGIAWFKTEEKDLKENDLAANRLIFIQSDLAHNDVIAEKKQFQMYLKTSIIKSIHDNK